MNRQRCGCIKHRGLKCESSLIHLEHSSQETFFLKDKLTRNRNGKKMCPAMTTACAGLNSRSSIPSIIKLAKMKALAGWSVSFELPPEKEEGATPCATCLWGQERKKRSCNLIKKCFSPPLTRDLWQELWSTAVHCCLPQGSSKQPLLPLTSSREPGAAAANGTKVNLGRLLPINAIVGSSNQLSSPPPFCITSLKVPHL